MKQKVHEFVIKVRFSEPVLRGEAKAAVRDTIHGDFFPYVPEHIEAYFKVVSFK